ncbi:hypothetical protein I7I50_01231 [Histoplasma capsulatum G186AR]|uniref:Uncharacterized protein n=1 Tax=Ajellomyces capsulatus TaxID=5037 RepID=A0A8H7YUQ0_AJECA|nr:hypothetical protein I7I52_08942 [Histoplasma capsulatum]QSS73168.1 hypothetical protein I7I50_01231 [Histoplasma capsulatum G186AR]
MHIISSSNVELEMFRRREQIGLIVESILRVGTPQKKMRWKCWREASGQPNSLAPLMTSH